MLLGLQADCGKKWPDLGQCLTKYYWGLEKTVAGVVPVDNTPVPPVPRGTP